MGKRSRIDRKPVRTTVAQRGVAAFVGLVVLELVARGAKAVGRG